MTPIRVRGRRYGQGPNTKAKSGSRSGSSTPTRLMELDASAPSEKDAHKSKRPRPSKALTAQCKPAKIAPKLEELPVEILQQVFSYCLEINLPRASLFLGQVFGRRDHENLTIQAFSKPSTHGRLGKYRATQCTLFSQEWQELRNQIATCRWFTSAFFKHCAILYLKHMVQSQWPGPAEEEHQPILSRILNFRDDGNDDAQLDETIHLPRAPRGYFTKMRWIYSSGKCSGFRSPRIPTMPEWDRCWVFPYVPRGAPHKPLHNVSYIPRVLCQPPFTASKIEKLELLGDIYGEIGPDSTELFNLGTREAIAANSLDALCSFLKLGNHPNKPKVHVRHGSWKSRIKDSLDPQHFIDATLRDWQFLARLVEHDRGEKIPRDDAGLTAWALEASLRKETEIAWLGTTILRMMTWPQNTGGS